MEPKRRKVTVIDTEAALDGFMKAHGYAEADLNGLNGLNGLVAELNAAPKIQFTDYDERMLRCRMIKV